MKQSLSYATFFFILCTGIMRFSGLLSKIILAKAITPYQYGIITLVVVSLPSMLQIITNIFFHDLLSHAAKGPKYFGFSMLYSTIVSTIISIIVYVFHEEFFTFLNIPLEDWEYLYIAFVITLFPTTYLLNMMGILRGYRKYNLTSLLTSAPSILRFFLVLVAVYLLGISDFNEILILFALPSLLITLLVFLKERGKITTRIKQIILPSREMFLFGISVFVIGISSNLAQSMIKILVSHQLGVEMQGYFDVSLTLLSILSFSFAAMQFISLPEATNNNSIREALYKKGGLGDITRALFASLIFCIVLLYFYSESLVTILFSEDYILASEYVFILAVSYIFLFIQQFIAYLNISTPTNLKRYKKLFMFTLILLTVFPFIIHSLITSFGFLGAYLASSLFIILYSSATIYYSNDLTPLKALFEKIDRLVISCFITSVIIYISNFSLIVGIFSSFIIYLCLIFLTGYLNKELIYGFFRK